MFSLLCIRQLVSFTIIIGTDNSNHWVDSYIIILLGDVNNMVLLHVICMVYITATDESDASTP